jgi:actin-related protein 3
MEVATKIKMTQGYVCKDIYQEFRKYDTEEWVSPESCKIKHMDGPLPKRIRWPTPNWTCDVGAERFLGPEILFTPSVYAKKQIHKSLPELIDEVRGIRVETNGNHKRSRKIAT